MTDVKQPELELAIARLERLDDLNESRQSDGTGAAHFFGRDLKDAMDRFHYDWSIVRAAPCPQTPRRRSEEDQMLARASSLEATCVLPTLTRPT